MYAITLHDVHKIYANQVHAVKGLSLNIKEHSFTAFLGKNGAGKSTTIHMMCTLAQLTSGEITLFDYQIGKDDEKIRSLIGVVFQHSMMDDILSVKDNLMIRGSMYGLSKQQLQQRIKEVSETLGIHSLLKQAYGSLSGGQKRKVDIARALLHQPRLLILDEPTTGLDPKSRQELWQYIHKLKATSKMTILLTTHYLEEVLDADQVIVIDQGVLVEDASSHELREKYTKTKLFVSALPELEPHLSQNHIPFHHHQQRLLIPLSSPFDALPLLETYKPWIQSFEIIQGSMDDVFFALTESEGH